MCIVYKYSYTLYSFTKNIAISFIYFVISFYFVYLIEFCKLEKCFSGVKNTECILTLNPLSSNKLRNKSNKSDANTIVLFSWNLFQPQSRCEN